MSKRKIMSLPSGGTSKAEKAWKPALTAASYRYFVRGTTEKPSKDDVKISQPGMRRLAPYDHMLRHFQCANLPATPISLLSTDVPDWLAWHCGLIE